MKHLIKKAGILIEALPYIKKFSGKTFVIKYGGKAMIGKANLKDSIAQDIVLLKFVGINPIVVHGGGPEISAAMKKAGLKPKFVHGLRVTDKKTVKIVYKVLAGKINKEIVDLFNKHGGKALGLNGKIKRLILSKKHYARDENGKRTDIGYVGEVVKINSKFLNSLKEYIPVIAPIGIGKEGNIFNINADDVASAVSASVKADKLVLLTDVDGIYKDKIMIATVDLKKIKSLIKSKVISGGMIPKVKACMNALKGGVKKTHIVNGNIKHSILLEIFTNKGIGTEIVK